MSDLPLLDVLSRYQSAIEDVVRRLEARYGKISLDRLWAGEVPSSGQVERLEFWFHGAGCTAHTPLGMVAWDWDDEGGLREFQVRKLWQFIKDRPEEFGRWCQWETLRDGLAQLVAERRLENVDGSSAVLRFVPPK